MKNILAPENAGLLKQVIQSRPLLAFDFDGTLAPLTDAPDAAQMKPSTRRLLTNLSRVFPCAIISGRGYNDIKSRVNGIPLCAIVGNHGLEWNAEVHPSLQSRVKSWEDELQKILPIGGIFLENKLHSLSVHLRDVDPNFDFPGTLSQLKGAKLIGGKRVINILPEEAPDKGQAFLRILENSQTECAVYVGDDETDESIFGLGADSVVTVRVGYSAHSSAEYFIQDQGHIDGLLAQLFP